MRAKPAGAKVSQVQVVRRSLRIIRPIEPVLLHDRVYEMLKAAVMAGHFLPGERIVVRELAEQFETSPMPVREAIRRLVALRAFVSMPNRTVRTPDFSPDTVRDLCRIRMVIEGQAAHWAASRMSHKLIEKLERLHRRELECLDRRDVVGLLEANRQLHFAIYEAAGSAVLIPCLEMLWLQVGPYFGVLRHDPDVTENLKQHGTLIESLRAGDGDGARACIAGNIATAAENIIAIWSRFHG
jgi:DNA-binding GntR family transcriptional regulator